MTTPERVSRETAQAAIDGQAVARILREAQTNFLNVYPPDVLSLGVGPLQSIIGLAILKGHLALPRAPLSPAVLAELPEVKELIRQAVEASKSTPAIICECGMTGPCMWDQCKWQVSLAAAIREARNG